MKIFTLFVLTLLLSIPLLQSQEMNETVRTEIYARPANQSNQQHINMLNYNRDIMGLEHTILYPDWTAMNVYGHDGDVLSVEEANYNHGSDEFFFKHNEELLYVRADKVSYIEFGEVVFRVFPYKFDKELKMGFFQVIVDGEFPLYKKYYLKKTVSNSHPFKMKEAEKITFSKSSMLYYLNNRKKVVEPVPTSKKKFIKIFKSNRTRLLKFAQEQDISPKNDVDVIRVFNYNNMLLESKASSKSKL